MMQLRKKNLLLTTTALALLLAPLADAADQTPSQQQLRRRAQGLEAYQRYTPPPAPVEEETPEETVVTAVPTSLPPTKAPTDAPTEAEVEPEKEDDKNNDKDKEETEEPTEEPKPVEETDAPTEPEEVVEEEPEEVVEEEAEQPAEPSEEPVNEEEASTEQTGVVPSQGTEGALFSETVQHSDSVGEVFVDFSLWSPTGDTLELDFEKLKMGVVEGIDGLVCDVMDPIREEKGSEFCAVRSDVLLKDTSVTALEGDDPTVIALASTNVNDSSGVVHNSDLLTWSTWRMSWSVTELGEALEQHIETLYEVDGETLTESEKNVKGLALLQQMMAVEMERNLRDGEFQNSLNLYLNGDFEVSASVVGEEINKFGSMLLPSKNSASAGEEQQNGEDEGGSSLLIVFFFVGLGVAAIVAVTLLYFTCRSRQNAKNTDKEEGSNAGTESNPDSNNSTPAKARQAEIKQDNEYVIEHEGALQEEPQQQSFHQQLEPTPQQWEEESVAEDDAGDEGAQNDEGSVQLGAQSAAGGRSVGQNSMYTAGSGISAITGVSGLEHSDTWSVGSMSIDLADWG